MKRNVIIIGAGASGLFCAAECAKRGRSVLVLDHAERTGSKVLISGGGRSNFTNLNVTAEHYLSRNPHFCRSALARFTPQDILSLVKKHGIKYYEKEAGQIFCVKSSREIIAMLEGECERAGAEIRLKCRVLDINKAGDFQVATSRGEYRGDSLVIATGGLSYANLGATGFGHTVAKRFGLRIVPPQPALVPLVFSPGDQRRYSGLSGISLDANVRSHGKAFRGNILFTHRGLSGPAILNASLHLPPGQPLFIDLLPGVNIHGVFREKRQGKVELRNLLAGVLPKRFAQTWCDHTIPSRPLNQYSDKELEAIAKGLHAWEIVPKGTEGYRTAEVTAGGVDTDGLSSKTMEAKQVPGLFFIGEVLDVTGELGGYNLHWAWASGHAAGQHA